MPQGFNIETFRSTLGKNGVLRNNKFMVRIPYPKGMSNSGNLKETSRYLELWCDSTNLPEAVLSVMPIRRYGYGVQEKMPAEISFGDITFTFMSDGNGAIWGFFQQWMKMVMNYDMSTGIVGRNSIYDRDQTPYEVAYKTDYITDIEIKIFHENGKEIFGVVLREAFPISLNNIQVNWADTNDIMRIPVTMTFTDWYRKSPDSYSDYSQITAAPTPSTGPVFPNRTVTGVPF